MHSPLVDEHPRGEWAGESDGEINDTDAVKRAGHGPTVAGVPIGWTAGRNRERPEAYGRRRCGVHGRREGAQVIRQLDGRVAVVTGAASGIGVALVEAFLVEGMSVVLSDVDGDALGEEVDPLSTEVGDRVRARRAM
ncbi:MAG: hypothetical protein Ct9H300mP12_16960 [Acidimicrobiales bacterium]|nr:MAG: hypothetical protein Ct9H300mP12_16960 [Acidimicrobiales bacterium]